MDLISAMGVFTRVVDHMSFSMAAAELGISSSSVSKQISQLEKHIGARLLQRTTRRLSVTETGAAYYEKCVTILSEVEEAESLVSQLQGKPRGVLRINCNMTFGQLLLAKAIPLFMSEYPDVQLDVTLDDGDVNLIKDGFDLALRITRPILPDSSLIAREIAAIPLCICASPEYLAQYGTPETPQELKNHNCLVFMLAPNSTNWTLTGANGPESVQVEGDLKANNTVVIRESVLAHRGLANLAKFAIKPYLETGEVKLLFDQYEAEQLSLFAVYPERQFTAPKVALFIEFFQQWLRENLHQ